MRHTKLLNEFSLQKKKREFLNKILKSRKEVEVGGSGTQGYRLKSGKSKGKVIRHIVKKPENI